MKTRCAVLVLCGSACVAGAQPTLVRLAPGAEAPAYLTPWHPEPFGDPALAEQVGLTGWYISESGQAPPWALEVCRDSLGTAASWPDDPFFPQQWALYNPGGAGAQADMDIDALAAFRLVQELEDAGVTPARRVLAIIDTDMLAALAIPAELRVVGWWNTALGQASHGLAPQCPHAVGVASVAANVGNNGEGMAGVCWTADVLAIQTLTNCYGTQATCAQSVVYAADWSGLDGQRVDVINMSLQWIDAGTPLFEAACNYAVGRDVGVVACSGNFSWNHATACPSRFPAVLAVGAINRAGQRPSFSNAGPELDLCAPGEDTLAYGWSGPTYGSVSGTSYASPCVAGAAALIRSVYPGLSWAQVRAALESSADDMGEPGRDDQFGHGRLNVYRALLRAKPCYADFDLDGAVTLSDFGSFQTSFAHGEWRANCDGDLGPSDTPVLSLGDLGCFLTKFAGGCP